MSVVELGRCDRDDCGPSTLPPALLEEYNALARVEDPTGNWVTGFRPAESEPYSMARWSAQHYWYYRALLSSDTATGKDKMRALDFGCAGGARSAQLRRTYGSVLGIDRTAGLIEFARKHNTIPGVAFLCDDFATTTLSGFDRVYCVEVLEHNAHEVQAGIIEKIMRTTLNPGGVLLLTMPNEPPTPNTGHAGTRTPSQMRELIEEVCSSCSGLHVDVQHGYLHNNSIGDPFSDLWCPWSVSPASHHVLVVERNS